MNVEDFDEINGVIESILYQNEENGYTVLKVRDENDTLITVVGCFPFAASGESITASGQWTSHPVHGQQFKADYSQRCLPDTIDAIYAFLSSGSIKGIGPVTASLILDTFGVQTLNIMENEPERLAEIKGISKNKAAEISKSFSKQMKIRKLTEYICAFGLRPVLAMRLYRFYGDSAMDIIKENPYILAAEHIGGTFAEADSIALESGMNPLGKNRINAAVLFELTYNTRNGHCFIPREKLAAVTCQLIDVDDDLVEASIDFLAETGMIVRETIAGCDACYLNELYEAETETASILARMSNTQMPQAAAAPGIVKDLDRIAGISCSEAQKIIASKCLENRVLVITGGPGTGKTTSINMIISLFDSFGMKTLLTAPTGRAAKRITEVTGRESYTIHRLLEAKFDEDTEHVVYSKNESDQLDCDAVILDETSMVDILLMHALLKAIPEKARLILVGDCDQLPSVGPGKVFSAIIKSGVVPTVCLTEIYRQNSGSRIISNAHLINEGSHPDFSANEGDFFRLKRFNDDAAIKTILELFSTRLPQKMGFKNEDIQVLTVTRKGPLGTVNLNHELQAVLNPGSEKKKEKVVGDVIFRVGDRIMQTRNNYDAQWVSEDRKTAGMGIFNGDLGIILDIDFNFQTLLIDFDGRKVTYSFENAVDIEHAWAVTVHKAQGSEYKAVILALTAVSPRLLARDILYTAVTRAKNLLILVGDDSIADRMIDSVEQRRRYNALRIRIRKESGIES